MFKIIEIWNCCDYGRCGLEYIILIVYLGSDFLEKNYIVESVLLVFIMKIKFVLVWVVFYMDNNFFGSFWCSEDSVFLINLFE